MLADTYGGSSGLQATENRSATNEAEAPLILYSGGLKPTAPSETHPEPTSAPYREWFARGLLPPALRNLLAAAAMASDFFSAAVWCALGLQLPLVPRAFPGTGV